MTTKKIKKILLATLGTKGDFFPFLKLAIELRSLGYEVQLAANVDHQPAAAERGLAFLRLEPGLQIIEEGWQKIARANSAEFTLARRSTHNQKSDFLSQASSKLRVAVPARLSLSRSEAIESGKTHPKAPPGCGSETDQGNPILNAQFWPHGTWALYPEPFAPIQKGRPRHTKILGFPLGRAQSAPHLPAPLTSPTLKDTQIILVGLGAVWKVMSEGEVCHLASECAELARLLREQMRENFQLIFVAGPHAERLESHLREIEFAHVCEELNYDLRLPRTKLMIHSGGGTAPDRVGTNGERFELATTELCKGGGQ